MKKFKEYLDDAIMTANLGPTSNYVGTRKKREGNTDASFVKGVPGDSAPSKKNKNNAIVKKTPFILQQRALPFQGGGNISQLEEETKEE